MFYYSVVRTKIARTGCTYQLALKQGRCAQEEKSSCVSREAVTAHKQRVHGGHFGSNKRMYTVKDGR